MSTSTTTEGAVSGTAGREEEGVTLESLRRKMADFARERDWEQFHSPRNLLLALVLSPLTFHVISPSSLVHEKTTGYGFLRPVLSMGGRRKEMGVVVSRKR